VRLLVDQLLGQVLAGDPEICVGKKVEQSETFTLDKSCHGAAQLLGQRHDGVGMAETASQSPEAGDLKVPALFGVIVVVPNPEQQRQRAWRRRIAEQPSGFAQVDEFFDDTGCIVVV